MKHIITLLLLCVVASRTWAEQSGGAQPQGGMQPQRATSHTIESQRMAR